ncbi:MAG: methyltransferase domain-containing protein [Myxococcota bacterium]|nr:methyltransferase domain-containing protein [Myxococcota bacterium]
MIDFGRDDWFATAEGRRFFWHPEEHQRLVGPELLDLQPGQRLLDLGCGWGYLGHLLLRSIRPGGAILGIDLETELLDLARSRSAEAGTGELTFEWGDALALDLPDNRFCRAVCQTLLIHTSRPQEVLREMARVVRPGGAIAAIEPDLLAARESRKDSVSEADPSLASRDARVFSHAVDGARTMGAGDHRIGARLGDLLTEVGLLRTRVWKNPRLLRCAPPYDQAGKAYLHWLQRRLQSEAVETERSHLRTLFDAGGGEVELWEAWCEGEDQANVLRRSRIAEGSYRASETHALYVGLGQVG